MPVKKATDVGLALTLLPGEEAVEVQEDPEAMRAFFEQVFTALADGPQPDHEDDVDDPEPDRYEEDDKSDEEEDPTRGGDQP